MLGISVIDISSSQSPFSTDEAGDEAGAIDDGGNVDDNELVIPWGEDVGVDRNGAIDCLSSASNEDIFDHVEELVGFIEDEYGDVADIPLSFFIDSNADIIFFSRSISLSYFFPPLNNLCAILFCFYWKINSTNLCIVCCYYIRQQFCS